MESKEAVEVTAIGHAVAVSPGSGMSLALHGFLASRLGRDEGTVVVDPDGTLCARFYQAEDRVINPYNEHHRAWLVLESAVEHEEGAKMSCGYTCGADPAHRPTMQERHALAHANRSAWLATFDAHGRYVDSTTGFWESLNGEMYVCESNEWVPAYDDCDSDDVGDVARLEVTIVRADAATAPDLPSHLFPGAGSDGALFRVTAGDIPSRREMSGYLDHAIVDANLVSYDESTGEGYFVVIDGDAPDTGTVIDLVSGQQCNPVVLVDVDTPSKVTVHPAMTIEQYYDELSRHDWYCGFSDSWAVEKQGEENYARLLEIANQHGADYLALIGAFRKHYFSGEPWNTPQYDKPARPVNGVLVLPPAPMIGVDTRTTRASDIEKVTDMPTDGPPPAEIQSYYEQDFAEQELIEAMTSISQTYTHGTHYGPRGHHHVTAIRVDHMGAIRRWIVEQLMRAIGWIAKPDPNATRWSSDGAR